MAVKPELSLRQTQRLALTPTMQQSLSVLRMDAAELADLVAREAADNPFLILRARHTGGSVYDAALATATARPGLMEQIRHQLRSQALPADVLAVAEYLASELRDDGYLDLSLDDVAHQTGLNIDLIEAGLEALQSCDPAGIGARDLAECLVLQLVDRGVGKTLAEGAVSHLDDFGQSRLALIARRLDVPEPEVQRIAGLLRKLDPRPLRNEEAIPASLLPDLIVRRDAAGQWQVELSSHAPALRLDPRLTRQAADFAPEQRQRAESLARAIAQRGETLLLIARSIIARQEGYFSHGPDHLRPMSRRDLAHDLGLHPSTLGRAVTGKGLQHAGQVVPLSLFFSTALAHAGGSAMSSFAVRRTIQRLVAAEPDGRPLSDAQIHARLVADGVDIARRTVAKYREGMKIPSSHERRRRQSRRDVPGGGN